MIEYIGMRLDHLWKEAFVDVPRREFGLTEVGVLISIVDDVERLGKLIIYPPFMNLRRSLSKAILPSLFPAKFRMKLS